MFSKKIGRNMEVYVDDMLVKSKEEGEHLDDLKETFDTLRQYKMKLNPTKCAFGVSSEKFHGVSTRNRSQSRKSEGHTRYVIPKPSKMFKN